MCSQARPTMALYEPKSLITENKTCWTNGPALKGKEMSPIVAGVAPLKPDRILPAELRLLKGMFICLKADSCSKSAALLRSISTLCTSNLLMNKVSTSAS